MNPSNATELDVPTIMRIGAARMTAGLDRMGRLDLAAHTEIFGPLPRMSAEQLLDMPAQVDLRGQGGAAFPFARKLKAVVDASKKTGQPTIVVVNATEGEPGSFKDKMLMIRSPYLILSGAALVAEALEAEEVFFGVTSNELANRSIEAAIDAEPGLRALVRVVQQPERFISGESGALIRGINGKKPVPPGRKTLAAEKGVDDLPTLLSNASTFAQIAVLALLGPERFASVGMPEEPGTVLLSVSGSAKHPAVVECATGVPLGSVLDICQAPAGDGVLVGGYHGMWLTADHAYVGPVSRSGMEAGRRPPRSAPPSGCRWATGPARWARCRGSPATWPVSPPGSAARASSACPASPGRGPPSWTARAASRPWTWPGVRPPRCPGAGPAPTRTGRPGWCCR